MTLRKEANEGQQAAGAVQVAAVGRIARVAVSADAGGEDVPLVHARAPELEPVRRGQVEEVLAGTAGLATEKAPRKTGAEKLGADVFSHFIAAGPDARSERGEEPGRVDAVTRAHPLDRLLQDAGQGAPPTAMNGRDGPPVLVDEKDGQTIGGPDDQEQPGRPGRAGRRPGGLDRGTRPTKCAVSEWTWRKATGRRDRPGERPA